MPLNAALRRLNEAGGSEFEASLGFIVKPCLKKKVTNKFKKKKQHYRVFPVPFTSFPGTAPHKPLNVMSQPGC
jgi:hypothetical protein